MENVFSPMGSGRHQIGIYTFWDAQREKPTAVIGLTDTISQKECRHILGKDVLTFAIPYRRFEEMEANAWESFLEKRTWKRLVVG